MPFLLKRLASAGVPGILVLGLATAQPAAATTPAAAAPTGAAVPFTVNPGIRNYLYGVTALSASDAWAAGYYCTANCAGAAEADSTLIAQWNGTSWSRVPSPSPGTTRSRLYSVSADSPTDAWAAGYYCTASCAAVSETDSTLIVHWDGSAWTQVPSPSVAGAISRFLSVSADSATDAWAAGYTCTSPCGGPAQFHTLIAHWNGIAWTRVHSPNPGTGSALAFGVSADSATDAWATGTYCVSACGTSSEADHMLMAHWNGTAWATVPSPNPSTIPVPQAVAADSPTDAWVAGWYNTARTSKALLLHWNGTAWSRVASPAPAAILYGVTATSPTNAWAVGQLFSLVLGKFLTVTLHWTGTTWARVPSPSPGTPFNNLFGVSADAPADAWAVGYYCASRCAENGEHDHALILHWNGTAWSRS